MPLSPLPDVEPPTPSAEPPLSAEPAEPSAFEAFFVPLAVGAAADSDQKNQERSPTENASKEHCVSLAQPCTILLGFRILQRRSAGTPKEALHADYFSAMP